MTVELLSLPLITTFQRTLVVKCMTVLFDELSVQGAASHAEGTLGKAYQRWTAELNSSPDTPPRPEVYTDPSGGVH